MFVDVSEINRASPYIVHVGGGDSLKFLTGAGDLYEAAFYRDTVVFGGLPVNHFHLRAPERARDGKHVYDPKVRETVFQILSNFLSRNQEAVVYICDDDDGMNEHRYRLFAAWFLLADRLLEERFIVRPVEYRSERVFVYGGMICRSDNPAKEQYFEALERYMRLFEDK
jgi:hypothetical protein